MTMHNHEPERYDSGKLKASQQQATRAYRRRQARLRDWSDELAGLLGITREELTATPAADLVATILRDQPDP
ncbi:hypothetical protein [Corynebacterium halotolerans]|uniref:hypothetical protein n=1 Tax=Corynebacterium halotolerans TaxID=225326 RepID=UPI003CE6B73F